MNFRRTSFHDDDSSADITESIDDVGGTGSWLSDGTEDSETESVKSEKKKRVDSASKSTSISDLALHSNAITSVNTDLNKKRSNNARRNSESPASAPSSRRNSDQTVNSNHIPNNLFSFNKSNNADYSGDEDLHNSTGGRRNSTQSVQSSSDSTNSLSRMNSSEDIFNGAAAVNSSIGASQESLDSPSVESVTSPSLHVLVAEDNVMNQKLIVKMLAQMKHTYLVVNNGRECVTTFSAASQAFDLIVMDVYMPEMDGIQATREIRSVETGHIPIIALTAQATPQDRKECLAAGMDAFVAKPAKIDHLRKIINDVVHNGVRETVE
jgi:CheY-like chemotaxis protein